jgi:hypothetical protein
MFALRRARMKLRRRKTCKQKGKKLQNLQNYNFRKITSLHQIMRAPVKSTRLLADIYDR